MWGVVDRIGGTVIGTAKGQTTPWKIQTSWLGGIGLQIFKDWCNGIVEKTGGELAFQPFGAQDVVGDFQLFDAVKNGVLDAMNPFTLYWAGRMPASVFLRSEEHTSELQSLMRISYAVFCLKKKNITTVYNNCIAHSLLY